MIEPPFSDRDEKPRKIARKLRGFLCEFEPFHVMFFEALKTGSKNNPRAIYPAK